jgi:ParB-like chromosome segregation protein Spo0J
MMDTEWEDGPVWMAPADLQVSPAFSKLFAIAPAVLGLIVDRMRREGYIRHHPIEVWRQQNVILDGHTRRKAAITAGVSEVPVVFLDFDTEAEAKSYARLNQRSRRNLTEAEILALVEAEHKTKGRGKRTDLAANEAKSGKAAESTAAAIGVSRSKVERALAVLADPEAREAVERGETTISAAATEVAKKKREARPPKLKAVPEPAPEREPEAKVTEEVKLDPAPKTRAHYAALAEAAAKQVEAHITGTLERLPEPARGMFVCELGMAVVPLLRNYGVTVEGVSIVA